MSLAGQIAGFVKTYSTGVVAAGFSITFATYMLITGGAGGGTGGQPRVVVRHVPVASPLKERLEVSIVPNHTIGEERIPPAGDMLITGSIGRAGKESLLRRPLRRGARKRGSGRTRYVLRFATPDVALVEGSGRMWSVEPGDILPGAGRVVRIETRGRDRWVVKTFDGRRIREISGR